MYIYIYIIHVYIYVCVLMVHVYIYMIIYIFVDWFICPSIRILGTLDLVAVSGVLTWWGW